ncbi:MAG TPA: STAS domain-containing protein [Acidobacteriaceae bacterium]|nr:STAS domain-containing protein [Acidobacteriaceae bacterium]
MKPKPIETGDTITTATETVIDVTRDGDWLPSDEFCAAARSAAQVEGDLTINLQGVDHLDASALQILLALAVERKKRGRGLYLANASTSLSHWFEYAGGRDKISAEREA